MGTYGEYALYTVYAFGGGKREGQLLIQNITL